MTHPDPSRPRPGQPVRQPDATRRQLALDQVLSPQRLVEEVSTGIAVTDVEGRFLWVNPAYARTVGYREEELAALDFVTLTHPDDRPGNLALIEQLLAGERDSFVIEKRYLTKQGEAAWVRASVSLLCDEDGEPAQLVATTEDISAQKEAEHRLEENQALLSIAGRVGRVGGWAIDADGTLHWSDEIYQLLGYPTGETPPLEETIDLYVPESREAVTEALDACLRDGTPFDLELLAITAHGDELWARAVGEPQWGPDGSVERIQGAFMDISDRKRAQAESEELAERLTTTLESITDSFYTLDTSWRFTYVNRRAQEVLRRDADSLLGRVIWEEFPAAVGSDLEAAYRRAVAEQQTVVIDEYHYAPLDTWFELNIYPSPQGLAVYFRDVTDRREARMALREREARLEELAALLDKAQDAIMVRDLDGRVTFWNDGAERIFGWAADEVIGHPVAQLLEVDPDAYQRATQRLLEDGRWFGEVVKRTRDGRELTVEARWTLVRDEEGAPDSVLHIDTDITERKRLEEQFLRSQRMESLGTLAGGVAHDLNNALMPVIVSAQILREEDVSEEGARIVDIIEESAQHGADLVQQMLSFARGVNGHRVTVSIPELFGEVERLSTDTFPKAITVEVDVADDVWPVTGDATQLRQVLVNLCVNARDALDGAGRITMSARNEVLDVLPPTSDTGPSSGRFVTLCVEDDGPGMSPELASQVFDPFFTTKEPGKGTGLGLSTSAVIVQSHGGFVEVDSEEGRGTVFKVHLPAGTEDATHEAGTTPTTTRGDGELVLLVDDDRLVLDTTRLVLERHGYRVLTAEGGAGALQLLDAHGDEIDVLLADLMMPEIDGVETIRRAREGRPGLPVVAASGFASAEVVQAALEAGAGRVLHKPFTAETIAAAIGEALGAAPAR